MEKNVTNPFEEGLSMLGMNFASRGFTWAENLYQKWEDICQNNIIVQEPSKIVDAVGEQVRKIYEEVTDDLLNPFSIGCDKAPGSDVCSKQDVNADVCKESWTSHDEGPINVQPLIYPTPTLAISSEEVSIAASPEIHQDERKEACDLFSQNIAFIPSEASRCRCSSEIKDDNEGASSSSTFSSHSNSLISLSETELGEMKERCNLFHQEIAFTPPEINRFQCSSEMKYDSEEVSSSSSFISHLGFFPSLPAMQQDERKEICDLFNHKITFTPPEANICSCSSEIRDSNVEVSSSSTFTDHSSSLPSADEISLSECPESMVKRELSPLHFANPSEEDGNSSSKEAKSVVHSVLAVPEQRSSSSKLDASPPIMDFGSSDCFSEHKTECYVAVHKETNTNEEFEDVSLEDFLEEKKLDDCWKESESYELALISYRSTKNRSYKKKLRDAFIPRFYSLKKSNEQESGFYGDIDADLAKIGVTPSSPVSSRSAEASNLLTLESYESDWELL